MFSYLETENPKDLAAALNRIDGVKVIAAFSHTGTFGVLIEAASVETPYVAVPKSRSPVALAYEAALLAAAKAEAKAEAKASKAKPAGDDAKKSDAPGPVIEI